MPNAHAQRLRLRLFLEGVEIPVIAANVQAMPNSPCVSSIQVPPLSEGTKLMPRTTVHLFFLDMSEISSPALTGGGTAAPTDKQDPTEHDDRKQDAVEMRNGIVTPDIALSRYKLLFCGEVVGFTWTKNQAQRSLILQCEDFSNYWDYAYQWSNTDIFGPGIKAIFSGGATNVFTDFLYSKGEVITQIVSRGRCNSYPKLKGLAAGIIRLVEAIGGTYFPRPGSNMRRIAGQNLFFSIAELRLRITHMITAYEDDPTSDRILRRQGYTGMFDRALGGLGQQVSIRSAINALTKIMFHETFPQPCPMFIPGDSGEVSGTKRVKLKGHPRWGFVSDNAEKAIAGIQAIKASLASLESEVGVELVDVKGPVQVNQKRISMIRSSLNQTLVQIRATKAPAVAQSIYSTASKALSTAEIRISQWRPKAPDKVKNAVTGKLDEALVQLKRAIDIHVTTSADKQGNPARLVQQILRPDIWFGAPPRCNVLFPEHYDSLSYQRVFLQEPTRFLLKTNDEFFGEDFLFDKFYFAPQAGAVKAEHERLQGILQNDVLDHELFTGILPVFEKMGEFNVFAARSGTAKGKVPKVGLAQRSANFLYFKHRFNARQMQVSGRFNPYIAVGFPGLIIDKYVDQDTIRLHNELRAKADLPPQEISEILGTNFLGNFTQVVHQVSQSPEVGRTDITISYPRQHDESVEFLGTLDQYQHVQKRADVDAKRATDIAAINAPKMFSLGPNFGRITSVQDVTSLYVKGGTTDIGITSEEAGKYLPIYDAGSQHKGNSTELAPIGVPVTAADIGSKTVADITGAVDVPVTFKAFRIEEEIPRYRKEEVLLPAEELIRPGWYDKIWQPSNIGKVYNAFFSTGAITDPQTITAPGATQATGQQSEKMEQALADQSNADSADDPRLSAPAAMSLEEGSSIQQAVEFLHLTYSYVRQAGNLDIEEFIRSYTYRPIATLVDMFGSSDLQYDVNGSNAMSGVEGLHSKAFGPYDDLYGLAEPEIEDILGLKRGTPPAQKADTRKRKLEKVQQYVSALRFSRAILG